MHSELESIVDELQKHRNDMAHGLWGHSDELPNALLLLPKFKYLNDFSEQLPNMAYAFATHIESENLMVCHQNQIEELYNRAKQVSHWYGSFSVYLRGLRQLDFLRAQNVPSGQIDGMVENLSEARELQWESLKKEIGVV